MAGTLGAFYEFFAGAGMASGGTRRSMAVPVR